MTIHGLTGMRTLSRISAIGLLGATLLAPVVFLPVSAQAQDDHRKEDDNRRYQDAKHHDEHAWNNHEDQAYRMWVKERHRKYNDFDRLDARDQQAYWDWRHDHSDAQLRINIR